MRKMSLQRRQLVVQAASLAAISGIGPLMVQRHGWRAWVWFGFLAVMMVRVIVLMFRLRRSEGCV